jgi:hypothetical protein
MATAAQLSWNELVTIAARTGVTNWRGPKGEVGKLILAPSSHRGRNGSMGSVVGCVRHHTGTDESYSASSDYPTYQVVKEGRAGLVNSLSAYGLGRYYAIYVFSEFVSWHAGTWFWSGITDGNGHFLGIEAEGTGRIWTPFQRQFYPRLCASILSYVGEGSDMMPRHLDGATPHGRKNDAANLWPEFTPQVDAYLRNPASITYGGGAPPPPTPTVMEDDMPTIVNILSDDGKKNLGFWLLDGSGYHAIGLSSTVIRLRGIKTPEVVILQSEHNKWVADQARRDNNTPVAHLDAMFGGFYRDWQAAHGGTPTPAPVATARKEEKWTEDDAGIMDN